MNLCFSLLAFFNFFTPEPPYYKYSNEIVEDHRKEILVPRNLPYRAIGGGNDPVEKIRTVTLAVSTKGPGSIEEGRRLLVFLVEDLLKKYNTHKKIRPHLTNFPYTPRNLTYTIWYDGLNGDFWVAQDLENPQKDIAFVAMFRGRVEYCINPSTKFRPLQEVFTESYEDAKKIVMEEQNTANK